MGRLLCYTVLTRANQLEKAVHGCIFLVSVWSPSCRCRVKFSTQLTCDQAFFYSGERESVAARESAPGQEKGRKKQRLIQYCTSRLPPVQNMDFCLIGRKTKAPRKKERLIAGYYAVRSALQFLVTYAPERSTCFSS